MESQATLPPEIAAQNKGPAILWATWTLIIMATVAVGARLFVRVRLLKNQGLDDYLISLSMACGYVYVSLTTASVSAGNGKHSRTLDTDDLQKAIKLSTAGFPAGVLSFVMPKFAVVALLVRILNPSRRHTVFLWFLTGLTAAYLVVCFIILYVQCDPPRAIWDLSVQNPKCWDSSVMVNLSIVGGAASAAVDLYLAVYPATVLRKLQMHWKKKLGLSAALGLGLCASAISIYKCTRIPSLGDKLDSTYSQADLVIWACVEANTLVIAACIPTLAPLLETTMGKKLWSNTGAGIYQKHKQSFHTSPPGIEFAKMKRSQAKSQKMSSQENILGLDVDRPQELQQSDQDANGGIHRQYDVSVEYEVGPYQHQSPIWYITK